jgi:hypothetical protein
MEWRGDGVFWGSSISTFHTPARCAGQPQGPSVPSPVPARLSYRAGALSPNRAANLTAETRRTQRGEAATEQREAFWSAVPTHRDRFRPRNSSRPANWRNETTEPFESGTRLPHSKTLCAKPKCVRSRGWKFLAGREQVGLLQCRKTHGLRKPIDGAAPTH